MRQAVNQWLRTTKELDGVIDFDAATVDPNHPGTFLPAFDCGDHLHPNDAGYKAMGFDRPKAFQAVAERATRAQMGWAFSAVAAASFWLPPFSVNVRGYLSS